MTFYTKYFFFYLALCLLISSCASRQEIFPAPTLQPTQLPSTITLTQAPPTATMTGTPTVRPTRARWPTYTASPTSTLEPIPSSTFVPALAVTRTLGTPAECPPVSDAVKLPDFEVIKKSEDFEKVVLDVLNAGGVDQLIQVAKAKTLGSYQYEKNLFYQDLTGDGVPEVVIYFLDNHAEIFILGCDHRQYKTLLNEKPAYDYGPTVLAIQDMNMNGVQDIALKHITCHYCFGIRVYEWDGQQFQSLVRVWFYDENGLDYGDMAELDGYATISISDIDHNGTYELVLAGGTPSYLGGMAGFDGPYRAQTLIYMWDGQFYTFHSKEYEPPRFRFEAVQDGDDASVKGKYDQALAFYQDAIFSDQLKSWTREVWYQLANQGDGIAPPDINQMPFNQTEYDQLTGYARYRIMLLHLVRGYESDAQTVYATLQKKFPQGTKGHLFVELATEFWNEYQSTQQIGKACEKAVAYATSHEDLLEPLGGQGLLGRWYRPEHICPFE